MYGTLYKYVGNKRSALRQHSKNYCYIKSELFHCSVKCVFDASIVMAFTIIK